MKENSIEENIERIAKLITTKFNNDYSIDNVDKEAIEELLKAYKELKEIEESHRKENGKLRERVKELEEENQQLEAIKDEAIRRYNFETIPKQKVKDKIEELNKQLEEDLQDEIKVNSNRFIIICQCKSCLQELLGSEE